jgi:Na+-transporting NADH:ubiquinone oxidoreductase subunit C
MLVVLVVVLITSSLVSVSVVILRPIQVSRQLLDRNRNILQMTGFLADASGLSDAELFRIYETVDARTVDLDAAWFEPNISPHGLDQRRAANDPVLSAEISPEFDSARLGRRSRHVPVYLVWGEGGFQRIILPIHGSGMWSTLYGYIALQADLNTIADIMFYEQNETPGLGDQVAQPGWLAKWRGRKIYDESGRFRFAVAGGMVEPGSSAARYEVDAITGATVTGDAVTGLMRYWFGPHGYGPFLERIRKQPPLDPTMEGN